ncbi:MAG TPA: hypothetical protein VMU02_08165 [bacterium]|nr:hypothetical protein [bacterium]
MQEERIRILKMLEDGNISADEAARLLDALTGDRPAGERPAAGKKMRLRVTDPESGRQTVNLTVPIGLAKFAIKFIPAEKKQQLLAEGIDIDSIVSRVMTENIGKIVDIESKDGNIQISIE